MWKIQFSGSPQNWPERFHHFQSTNSWFRWKPFLSVSCDFCFSACELHASRSEMGTKVLVNYFIWCFWCDVFTVLENGLESLTASKAESLDDGLRKLKERKTSKSCCCCIWFSSASIPVVLSDPWDTPWVLLLSGGSLWLLFVSSSQDPFDHLWLVENIKAPSCVQDQ